jgi:hypothetical protein
MHPATKADGSKYYEYVLIYIADILALLAEPKAIMQMLSAAYQLKEKPDGTTYEQPTWYLGADIGQHHFNDDAKKPWWTMLADTYIKQAIKMAEAQLHEQGLKLKAKVLSTLPLGYQPKIIISVELDAKGANRFELIRIFCWSVELRRINIAMPVALLSSFLAAPRREHLESVYHIFAYLKAHARSKIVFNDNEVDWDASKYKKVDWTDFYPNAEEPIPPNDPEPHGKPVQINCFVHAGRAGNKVTRRSHSGILIYLNSVQIDWYSK